MGRMSTLNFNVGILGHIDSGKTSLAKALSTVASTAAFDKNPQSRERGITLDLGFSSFIVPTPPHLTSSEFENVQFTLVDCPGHASLIRTVIGGAQIIDLMLLVIDATKGMQTQTAECLVIGEITCPHLVVALNKVDLLSESTRAAQIAKLCRKLSKTLEHTRFSEAPIIPVSAQPDGGDSSNPALGIDRLIEVLTERLFLPVRDPKGPFLFNVDHCFAIRGQGTVMTGTILSGSVTVNQTVEIPVLKISKKVKSIQMFHKPVQRATQGDRIGICVTQFDPSQVERCLVSSPGFLSLLYAVVIRVFKIPYHKSDCKTGGKFHVTAGHETVMAKTTFFGSPHESLESTDDGFIFRNEFDYQESLLDSSSVQSHEASASASCGGRSVSVNQFALLEFEKPIVCPPQCKVIGSRLDSDAFSNTCRIAFHGTLIESITQKDYEASLLPRLKIFKCKKREGIVDRIQDERTVIGRSLFKKETKLQSFVSMKVQLSTGETGHIEGAFGTSGKFRVAIPNGLSPETIQILNASKVKQKVASAPDEPPRSVKIILEFKRYIFDPSKSMVQ